MLTGSVTDRGRTNEPNRERLISPSGGSFNACCPNHQSSPYGFTLSLSIPLRTRDFRHSDGLPNVLFCLSQVWQNAAQNLRGLALAPTAARRRSVIGRGG